MRNIAAVLASFLLLPASAASAATTRHVVDQPDDSPGPQVHIIYAVPADGIDRHLDTNDTLQIAATSMNQWLGDQSGRQVRLDRVGGLVDVSFLRLTHIKAEIAEASNIDAVSLFRGELAAAGFDASGKIYAVYYDGPSSSACGLAQASGTIAIAFLRTCTPTAAQQWDLVMLHEIFHTLGAVSRLAPHTAGDFHVNDDPLDLMAPTAVVAAPNLDLDHQDYFGHGDSNRVDIAASPMLEPAQPVNTASCRAVAAEALFQAQAPGGLSSTFIMSPRGCAWILGGIPSWLTVNSPLGIGTTAVSLVAARNMTATARSAVVTITVNGQTAQSVFISQAAGSDLLVSVDTPSANAVLRGPFLLAGWMFDRSSTDNTAGVRAIHVWASPDAGGAPTFLGAVQPGFARPDVAAAFQNPRGALSGWGIANVTLPVGGYTVTVYPLSDVSGQFEFGAARTVHITVALPQSDPLMWVDTPTKGQALTAGAAFGIAGWAVDKTATAGSGVDVVHIWAYPTSGAPALFVGAATLGFDRPDVAAFVGRSSARPSGFGLIGTLPAGSYTLVVYARSVVTGTFNNAIGVPITVK